MLSLKALLGFRLRKSLVFPHGNSFQLFKQGIGLISIVALHTICQSQQQSMTNTDGFVPPHLSHVHILSNYNIIFQIEVVGVLASSIVLYFFHNDISVLWVFCSALGFFTGPIIPSAFAWANRYIEVGIRR